MSWFVVFVLSVGPQYTLEIVGPVRVADCDIRLDGIPGTCATKADVLELVQPCRFESSKAAPLPFPPNARYFRWVCQAPVRSPA